MKNGSIEEKEEEDHWRLTDWPQSLQFTAVVVVSLFLYSLIYLCTRAVCVAQKKKEEEEWNGVINWVQSSWCHEVFEKRRNTTQQQQQHLVWSSIPFFLSSSIPCTNINQGKEEGKEEEKEEEKEAAAVGMARATRILCCATITQCVE